ncbi:Rne/Rng family ribonuclease [Taylorella equigenitalis]|uniref:Rne/Rng family ribonuclease n=1 Tax=Taylorella equigenitalis TaxID=29575 RepID=UPI003B976B57
MKRMLFNATHQEELRVAIVDGQKLLDIDIETSGREQRKGNIYKGVITRIEPSLEACFVDYGQERHGFLPFKEVSRNYHKSGTDHSRISEALEVGQELIIQVEKEERGNKGAALTTYISLAGRYLVLMPNNPKGGGISRRIDWEERQELREAMSHLELPEGMSLIARTAGIGRTTEELNWDLTYLMQLWKAIEDAANHYSAPILIYQESSLVIRALRDYFSHDITEILIDTDEIYDQVNAFMQDVMPDNVAKIKRYRHAVPLFSRFQVEHQIETAYSRHVHLPSGGSIVIDHTEALVAVDVNSARSTRGGDIEETAMRTNIEAAEEVARQLRLRDLGGLIVIDFIDMEDSKNQKAVESKLKEAIQFDRARVQMGKISKFGLMELSRQRLRPSLNEGSHIICPRCNGTGAIRDIESSALNVLRLLQEEALKENTAVVNAQVPVDVATYLLNEKRQDIVKMEAKNQIRIYLIPSKNLETPHYNIERIRHDESRMDELPVSYKLTDDSIEEIPSWQEKKDQPKAPEAVVKGIRRQTPAPTPSPKTKETNSTELTFWQKILSFFGFARKDQTPEITQTPKVKTPASKSCRKPHSSKTHKSQNHKKSSNNDEIELKASPSASKTKSDSERLRNKPRKAKSEENSISGFTEVVQEDIATLEKKPQNRRRKGKSKSDKPVEVVPATETAPITQPSAEPTEIVESDSDQPKRHRNRRGRSRNKNNNNQAFVPNEVLLEQQDILASESIKENSKSLELSHATPNAIAEPLSNKGVPSGVVSEDVPQDDKVRQNIEAPSVSETIADFDPQSIGAEVAPKPLPRSQGRRPAEHKQSAMDRSDGRQSAMNRSDAESAGKENLEAVDSKISRKLENSKSDRSPKSIEKSEQTEHAENKFRITKKEVIQKFVFNKEELLSVCESIGMTWIETDPSKIVEIPKVDVKLGRERKPLVPLSNEPLEQVETKIIN